MPRFNLTRLSGFSKPKNLSKINNLVGQQFTQLTVISLLGINKEGRPVWLCLCDCGNLQVAATNSLRYENTKSCGCRRAIVSKAKATVHGQSHTNLYYRWQKLFSRCYDPSDYAYHNYGGRGIKISNEWHLYANFFRDVGLPPTRQHSLDRIDNNGHYEKGNTRWATKEEQGGNKRNNYLITANNETYHLAKWARIRNIKVGTLRIRLIRYGWTPEEALEFIPRRAPSRSIKER